MTHTYSIGNATAADVRELMPRLRSLDRAELEGLGGTPERILWRSYRTSVLTRVARVDGEIAALWGVSGPPLAPVGQPWLLTAKPVERLPIAFLREARREVFKMLEVYPRLENQVLASYTQAVRFIGLMGFTLEEPKPYPETGVQFCRFFAERKLRQLIAAPAVQRCVRSSPPPFIIYALPRSRTAWLSTLLTYRGWECHHEIAAYMRTVDDAIDFFARPNVGSVETAAAQGWRVLHHHIPDLKAAVIRRPVDQVVSAMLGAVSDSEVWTYDVEKLRKIMAYGDRMLAQIERHPGVLSVSFDELRTEDGCAAIFEHCLPYKFDREWWLKIRDRNIQIDVPKMLSYMHENRDGIDHFKADMKRELRRLVREGILG